MRASKYNLSRKTKKITFIFIPLSILIGVITWFSINFAPGSYSYAEEYELNFSEAEVQNAIESFKFENPEYMVPKITINSNQEEWELMDEPTQSPPHWHKFYFYYKPEDQIIYTWIRPKGENKTIFAFVSINDGLTIQKWKDINKDFSHSEKKKETKKFEERILNKIQEKLKQE